MDHPTPKDLLNKAEREAAYWRERCEERERPAQEPAAHSDAGPWFASVVGSEMVDKEKVGWIAIFQALGTTKEEALGHAVASVPSTQQIILRTVWQPEGLLEWCHAQYSQRVPPGMMWIPHRQQQQRGLVRRFRAAWLVLTGRADALEWLP